MNNEIKTLKIGDQIWMAENLNVDHYRNGDSIPYVQDINKWKNLKKGAWCYYDGNSVNGNKYGRLYNFDAISDPRSLVPEGWHIPLSNEWKKLEKTLEGKESLLKKLGVPHNLNLESNTFDDVAFSGRDGNFDNIDFKTLKRIESGFSYYYGRKFKESGFYYWWARDFLPYESYIKIIAKICMPIIKLKGLKRVHGLFVRCIKD